MAKTTAERKAEQRLRDDERNKALGLEKISVYSQFKGTRECLDFLKEAGGFEQDAEAITIMIHSNAEILKRDMSRKDELLQIPTQKTA